MAIKWSHNARQVPTNGDQAVAQEQRDQNRRLGAVERGSPQIIRGRVNGAAGTIINGEGFTFTRTAKGIYKITLTFELPTPGIIVATLIEAAGNIRIAGGASGKKEFPIEGLNIAQSEPADINFNFFIIAS